MDRQQRLIMRTQRVDQGELRGQRQGALAEDPTMQYRDDVGLRMTDEQYKMYQGKYTEWDNRLSGYEKQLSEGEAKVASATEQLNKEKAAKEAEINSAYKKLRANDKSIEQLYKAEQSKWVDVRVVDPSGTKIEQVYKLPKSAIPELQKTGYFSSWVDNGKAFNISTKAKGGKIMGKELHTMMNTVQSDIKRAYYEKVTPDWKENQKQIKEGYKTLDQAKKGLVESYNSSLNSIMDGNRQIQSNKTQIELQRQEQQESTALRIKSYEERLAERRALLGGGDDA